MSIKCFNFLLLRCAALNRFQKVSTRLHDFSANLPSIAFQRDVLRTTITCQPDQWLSNSDLYFFRAFDKVAQNKTLIARAIPEKRQSPMKNCSISYNGNTEHNVMARPKQSITPSHQRIIYYDHTSTSTVLISLAVPIPRRLFFFFVSRLAMSFMDSLIKI